MPKPDVLERVAADLALGHTQPAIQRLSSLVAAHPTDLDLRRRLARLYRMVGNRIEAGRWNYLTPGADTGELAAFERAFPSPSRRLAELRWPQRPAPRGRVWTAATARAVRRIARAAMPRVRAAWTAARAAPRNRAWDFGPAPTGYARARLDALAQAARRELAGTATEDTRAWRAGWWSPRIAGLGAAGLAAAFFVVLGALTVVQWLLR
ncbi:MAG: hypothetical protein IRZ05_17610 [Micromonosporaceae bacterium]|jgi:hypothetical protein|nr:hypothetical protein [Micromonosporaceae bacterium]